MKKILNEWRKYLNEEDLQAESLSGFQGPRRQKKYEAWRDARAAGKSLEFAFREAGLAGQRDQQGRNLTPFWGQSIPESRREGIEELVRAQSGKVWNYNNEVYVMIDPELDRPGRVPIWIYDSKGKDWEIVENVLGKLGFRKDENLHVPRSSAYDL